MSDGLDLGPVVRFDEILKRLLKFGFLTGSRAFGTAKEESDWDIVYPVYFTEEIEEITDVFATEPSNYFSGYTIQVDGKTINLIPVHPHEFLPWYLATKAVKETLKTSGLSQEPIKKYSVFMGIVSLYKGTVEQLGNVAEYAKKAREIIALEQEPK